MKEEERTKEVNGDQQRRKAKEQRVEGAGK